jgi:hypothetical protein
MAYYLEIPSGTAYVSIPDTDLFSRTEWRVEAEMGVNAALSNFSRLVILGRSGNGQAVLEVAVGGPHDDLYIQFAPRGGSSQVVITALERSKFEDTIPHIFVISRTNNVLAATFDTGSFGTTPITDLATLDNDAIAERGSGANAGYNLYRLKAYDAASGGNLLRDYNPSSSGGSGVVLKDDVDSANDGTLENFTGTINSWWQSYENQGDGGSPITYELTPEPGIFTYTGSSVQLLANKALTPQSGTFTYSGGNTSLAYNRAMTITGATYSYSADPLQLLVNRVLNIETGTFDYSGGAVTLEYSPISGFYELTPAPGIFNYSGSAVDLLHNRTLTPEPGEFSYTADPLNLAYNRAFTPETGEFSYTADSIAFARSYALSITGGVFNYSGGSITLNYSGKVITLMSNYTMSYTADTISINYSADSVSVNYLGNLNNINYLGH